MVTGSTATATAHGIEPSLPRRLVVVTSFGWALGIVAGVALIIVVESLGLRSLQSPLILGVALGIGWQQSRALRPILARSRARWVVLSCLGLAGPFAVADVVSLAGRTPAYDLVTFVILGGIIASVLQWNLLRTAVDRAGGWLIASPAGYLAAASTVWLNEEVLPNTPGIAGLLQYLGVILAGGVLLGLCTAVAASRFRARVIGQAPS